MRRRGGVAGTATAVIAGLALLAGCADDGRELRPPSPDQTTTTATPAGTGDPGGTALLRLTSPALSEGQEVPTRHTCFGADVSPELAWEGVPAGTAEIAVVVRDPDAGGFVHWVVAGLAPDAAGLDEGTVPAGAVEATNGFGEPGWRGPCPPEGTHRYDIRVYALAEPSGIAAETPGDEAAAAIESAPNHGSAALSVLASAPG
ncbi:MAG TPA: YbhB/YbcL family Raf kinase inhibitor-like protein [Acidimicrobiales bacterium]